MSVFDGSGRAPVNDKIVARARELLQHEGPRSDNWWPDRGRLRRIVNGTAKTVEVSWWREENGVTPRQVTAKSKKDWEKKLAGIRAMTDAAANPNEHSRRVAETKLAELEAAGPPMPSMRSAPGLEEYDREEARMREAIARSNAAAWRAIDEAHRREAARSASTKPVNTTKAEPGAKPRPATDGVNTTKPKKPRSADRHLEPNRDRHRPGYMREYMRRKRAAERKDR